MAHRRTHCNTGLFSANKLSVLVTESQCYQGSSIGSKRHPNIDFYREKNWGTEQGSLYVLSRQVKLSMSTTIQLHYQYRSQCEVTRIIKPNPDNIWTSLDSFQPMSHSTDVSIVTLIPNV